MAALLFFWAPLVDARFSPDKRARLAQRRRRPRTTGTAAASASHELAGPRCFATGSLGPWGAPPPRNHPPHRRQRRQDAGSKRTPTQYRQPCAPAQNTRHGRKWCTKHLSYLPVIESQRQNPCCRTLAFTCADAGCPSTPGSHDFGPPPPASWYKESPKNPPARRPDVPSIRRERRSPNQNPLPSLFT